jgi:hypothetical protein
MKPNLYYKKQSVYCDWRITLGAPGHSISVLKRCTLDQALEEAIELETEVEWIVTLVGITRET